MNCLILKDGKQIFCNGGMHYLICRRQLKMSLSKFLQTGGIRIMSTDYGIAIEFYGRITKTQNAIVNRMLKEQPVYMVVMPTETITRFRAIKTLDLC